MTKIVFVGLVSTGNLTIMTVATARKRPTGNHSDHV